MRNLIILILLLSGCSEEPEQMVDSQPVTDRIQIEVIVKRTEEVDEYKAVREYLKDYKKPEPRFPLPVRNYQPEEIECDCDPEDGDFKPNQKTFEGNNTKSDVWRIGAEERARMRLIDGDSVDYD